MTLVCSLMAIVSWTATADETDGGCYLGPVATMVWINGDYNGLTSLSGSGETWLIPKVKPGLGYGGVIGITGRLDHDSPWGAALEAGFIFAPLDGTYSGLSLPVRYFNVNACWRLLYEFIPTLSVYGQFAFGWVWITIENGASDGTTISNVTLDGLTGNLGAGLSWSPISCLAIRAGIVQYLSAVEHGSGIAVSGSTDPIDDSPMMIETGVFWRF